MVRGVKKELKSNVWSCSDLSKASKKLWAVKKEEPDMDTGMQDPDLENEIKASNPNTQWLFHRTWYASIVCRIRVYTCMYIYTVLAYVTSLCNIHACVYICFA